MKFRIFATILLVSIGLLTLAGYERVARAQDDLLKHVPRDDGAPMPEIDKQLAQPGDDSDEEDFIETDVTGDIKPIKDDYVITSYDNLAKLYWALGMLKPDDQRAIDNFLLITECDLYQRFYHNDFEWIKIREATLNKIKKETPQYPMKFEIIIPIEFGRYDVDKQEFEVTPKTKIIDMRKLDFSHNPIIRPVCGVPGEIYGYPHNIIVALNRAFTLERVPVDPEIAELYIDETRDMNSLLPVNVQMPSYRRQAFLRLKVHITKYKETVYSISGDLRAVLFASIDGVEVYADSHKMKPMYMSSSDSKRGIKFRRGAAILRSGDMRGIADPPRMPRQMGSTDIISFGSGGDNAAATKVQNDGTVDTSAGASDYDTNYDHAPNEIKPKPRPDPAPAPPDDSQPAN
jgi:hypothetical protein